MATTTISSSFLLLSLCLLYSSMNDHAVAAKSETTQTIQLTSLIPSSVCTPSTNGTVKKSTLEVVHKHGPCYQNGDAATSLSHSDILRQDQSRVDSIQAKLSRNSTHSSNVALTDSTTLPAKDGSVVGSGSYIVTVGLGTPKKELSLIFDTGSDLTWTQCQPCVKSCYKQVEAIFDPRLSKTYANISCSSALCSSLTSATGITPRCASSTCVYGTLYGDSSFSIGFFAKETITLTTSYVFTSFLFGCGEDNQGGFRGAAGLLGLGRDPVSIVSQTAKTYKKIFSYCLPSTSSRTGYLTFGNGGGVSKSVQFTPLSTVSQVSPFYGIDITGISVAGKKLPIQQSVFTTAGAIIDSGTVITRLPPAAYSSLRSAFRKQMSQYPTAPPLSILDTCYNLRNYTTVSVPKISFSFSGGVNVDLDISGILYANTPAQVCLGFAGNSDATDIAIFGNVQQKTLKVVYDGAGGKVGFGAKGCA